MSCAELMTRGLEAHAGRFEGQAPAVKLAAGPRALLRARGPDAHAACRAQHSGERLQVRRHAGGVSGRPENGSVILSFKDDGPGIPPEDRERVFDRFYQVEKTFCGQVPGAGLGPDDGQANRGSPRRQGLGRKRARKGRHDFPASFPRSAGVVVEDPWLTRSG